MSNSFSTTDFSFQVLLKTPEQSSAAQKFINTLIGCDTQHLYNVTEQEFLKFKEQMEALGFDFYDIEKTEKKITRQNYA